MALCPLPIHLRLCALFILWNFTLYLIYLGLFCLFRLRLYCLIFSIAAFILLTFLYLGLLILFKSDICSFTQFIQCVSHASHLELFTLFEVDSIFTDNYGLLVFLKFPLLIFFGSQFLLIYLIEALLFLTSTLCPVTCRQGASIHWVHQLFYLTPYSA